MDCLCKKTKLIIPMIALLVSAVVLLSGCADSGADWDDYADPSEIVNAGYVGTDLSQSKLREAILSGKITDASDLLYKFPKRKPSKESGVYSYGSETMDWLDAAYAIQMEANNMDSISVGGVYSGDEDAVEALKVMLRDGWGIKDRKTLVKCIRWILDGGHRDGYAKFVRKAKEQGITELGDKSFDEYWDMVREKNPDLEDKDVQRMAYAAYCSANEELESIEFWDYSRAISLLGWSYVVGYITLDEYVFQGVPIGMMIQKDYESWEEAGKVYLQGYKYWKLLDVDSLDFEYYTREAAYEALCENTNSHYSVSFDLGLIMERDSWY